MCGGGGGVFSAISNVIQSVSDTVSDVVQDTGKALASIDPGPSIGNALASVDKAVNNAIPGGWLSVVALAAAAVTAGAGFGLIGPEAIAEGEPLLAADGTVTQALSDGSSIVTNADGTANVFDASGNPVGSLSQEQLAADPTGTSLANPPPQASPTEPPVENVGDISSPDAPVDTPAPQEVSGETAPTPDASAQQNLGSVQNPDGTSTQTFDDGSTITTNEQGDVLSNTEAPADPYNPSLSDARTAARIGNTLLNQGGGNAGRVARLGNVITSGANGAPAGVSGAAGGAAAPTSSTGGSALNALVAANNRLQNYKPEVLTASNQNLFNKNAQGFLE